MTNINNQIVALAMMGEHKETVNSVISVDVSLVVLVITLVAMLIYLVKKG